MTQMGFFFDQSRCVGCQSCVIACKQWHDIMPGPVKWIRVQQWETGTFPDIKLNILALQCYHCENPVCVKACPNQAIYKEEKYGAVLVNGDKCSGARKCYLACPYGAPQFGSDNENEKMSKCNMCIDRLSEGKKPICVLSCSMRALEFGPLEELEKKYGHIKSISGLPRESITQPAVIFKPADAKSQVIPYDYSKAIRLWQKRDPDSGILPDVINDLSEALSDPGDIVGRHKLVIKAKTASEKMDFTVDDE